MPNFSDNHPDDELLETARMAATTDWEEEFVRDMLRKRRRWRGAFELTPEQRRKLEQIAGEDA